MGLLTLGFFATALLYASVGFGGGSTYSALLALAEFDYRLLPIVSLACNILVVTGSTIRFGRAGLVPWRRALTLSLIAAPLAFLGGLTPIREETFLFILGLCLVLAGLALFLPRAPERESEPAVAARWMGLAAGPLGYLAGLVGIGGGIFLAPLLHLTRWARAREIAATASLFILINSIAGLAGQLAKNGPERFGEALGGALPLLVAVVIGGQLGSLAAQRLLPDWLIRWLTAGLTIWVGGRLLV
ncbi:sulfite exporter TauE/SafE family protein [Novosphingobium sp.]|uniref:sulfite exporter TauE/SafE family protein n=1 Tax=Novosphingobium sp. TaxID=1874826 RepID=UPI0022C418CF|nr:sulfite exporter TauE/SafE family protein [Novosphingobium sp.]MCZ8017479.1 sulfite exporter TauE/SafE family protein [Novosphingobium sp.]MCZ8033997.1 sulfite exporter TauE/SafE family protein [Novosphingobium sp.]MCZ8051353.1 sulfite exporter TauE/SafE family protein [Novosphingobium sp.]MCZ8059699.1 sulfite exporter TauE/SafE family protein [Novosphingobium sp.]MCZ8231537.1 sulfite exporter TauE/SafE family protein [Novosphingobium sp.]